MSYDEGTGGRPYYQKVPAIEIVSCEQCSGKGYIKSEVTSIGESEDEKRICLACDGKGWWEK